MADYDAIVIGAGNGGLTSAATMAKKGLKVLVLERHNIPGGSATSFCRGRYEFEVALHQLSGLGTEQMPGPLRGQLKRIDVLDKLEFLEMDDLYRIQMVDSNLDITLKPDRTELVKELQAQFPHEKKGIKGYIDLIYEFFPQVICVHYMKDPEATPKKYPLFFKYALKNVQEVIDQFIKDPIVQAVLTPYWVYIGIPPKLMSFTDMAAIMFSYCEFKPFHLKGGSQSLSNAIADTIVQNGGVIRFNCGAKKIIVKNGSVQGVVTDLDEEIASNYVVSNASKISTYIDLIDREHVPETVLAELRQTSIGESAFIIFLGLDCEPETMGIQESTNFIFPSANVDQVHDRMKTADISEQDGILLTCYNSIDPSFSPDGASLVTLVTLKYGDSWLSVPPQQYAKKKYQCADVMLKTAEKLYPDLKKHIEEIEIATPITCMRYLGHPKGSIYGFDHFIKDSENFISNQSHIKGLYGAGGWVGLCGFQPTLESGMHVGRKIVNEINA